MHENHTETELQSTRGRLVVLETQRTETRLALEVRAGMPGVGRTSQDAAGLSSTNRIRVKVARTSVENGPRSLCSETETEIQLLLL